MARQLPESTVEERGFRLALDADVYVPAEDSWMLVDFVERERVRGDALDMGTGSGVAALALARAGARVLAVDVNPQAARLARANARANRLAVSIVAGDLWAPIAPRPRFRRITFNAPYLPSTEEERIAGDLDHAFHGGTGGVEVALAFLEGLDARLAPGGDALVVLSTRGDLASFEARARALGFRVDVVSEERFFFEAIRLLRLRRTEG